MDAGSMSQHERVWMTRAEYEAQYGVPPRPDAIGALFYGPDDQTVIFEIRFYDWREEITSLEDLARK